MAKRTGKQTKNRRGKRVEEEEFEPIIQRETVYGVLAVLLLAIAIFLVLAAFGIGGFVGETIFSFLSMLLGVGYALLPLTVLLAAAMLFRAKERRIGVLKWISAGTFFIAALGLADIALPGRGGIVGGAIAAPLISAVGTPAAVIFLIAFIAAALLLLLDVHPTTIGTVMREKFGREPSDEELEDELDVAMPVDDIDDDEGAEEEEYDDEEDYEDESEDAPAEEPKRTEAETDGFSIMGLATGAPYEPPPVSLLGKNKGRPEVGDVKANANIIKRTLQNFGISVEMDEVSIGPTVTRYAMKPAEGVRLTKILTLQSNLELALAASPIRIEAPIPGKSLVGIEVPNQSRTTLGVGPLFMDAGYTESEKPLLVALGRSITGIPHYADLARTPHILIAGATGSGKSVTINGLIISLLYRCGPEQLRFVMIDPKRVELTLYNSIPHLLTPVITDPKKAIMALKWLAKEMDRRYDILEAEKVRDIGSYHTTVVKPAVEAAQKNGDEDSLPEAMPYIVVIIDELADIMQTYPRELEAGIVRLAQMSRAVGIHLVLSTQRPSVKVITGLIKANVPARIALQVASQIDSRTILDTGGAEKLLGAGDMLFLSGEMAKPSRIQAPFISDIEVKKVVKWLAKAYEDQLPNEIDFSGGESAGGSSNNDAIFSSNMDDDEEDDMYGEAKQAVMDAGRASTSYLQRKLRIGYARAARLMDILEENGVIGPADGARPRDVLIGKNNPAEEAGDDLEDEEDDDLADDELEDEADERTR